MEREHLEEGSIFILETQTVGRAGLPKETDPPIVVHLPDSESARPEEGLEGAAGAGAAGCAGAEGAFSASLIQGAGGLAMSLY